MEDDDVWPRVTNRPAELLGLGGEIGTLQPGACADLVVLTQTSVDIPLQDVNGKERTGPAWAATAVVRGGEVVVSGLA
jgi:imidazolonepropionase-like amidohydrolase